MQFRSTANHQHHHQTRLLAKMWDYMGLIRVYTKRRGAPPLFNDPLVLSSERKGISVEVSACRVHAGGGKLLCQLIQLWMDGSRPPRWPTTVRATNPLTNPPIHPPRPLTHRWRRRASQRSCTRSSTTRSSGAAAPSTTPSAAASSMRLVGWLLDGGKWWVG